MLVNKVTLEISLLKARKHFLYLEKKYLCNEMYLYTLHGVLDNNLYS